MSYSNIPSAQTVIMYCKSMAIKNVVISPGSRNAPLTIGFSENSFFQCYSIVDERCAAFFALGMAQQLKKPVALLCTSGSALLNYYPAVAEAFYSDIPLVVISADRPPYKIDRGDGQTIRQENVFKNHIAYSANLKLDVSHASDKLARMAPQLLETSQEAVQHYNEIELYKALETALLQKAPVHINVPFEEPLYEKTEKTSITLPEPREFPILSQKIEDLEAFATLWNTTSKKMILVGVMDPDSIHSQILHMLASDSSLVVFTETTSNLYHPNFFSSIDSIIFPIEKSSQSDILFEKLQPELLVTFGGMVVSKKIKAFLRRYRPKIHWHIDEKKAYDTYFSLSKHFRLHPNIFFEALLPNTDAKESGYRDTWLSVRDAYVARRDRYLQEIPFSDFWAHAQIIAAVPEGYVVHIANSSAIRYAQLFDCRPTLDIFCNRGTSGIDGSTSTAIGASLHTSKPTVLITGDLSFFYDGNALWNQYIKNDFRIILMNNNGGGIFRILPGKENSNSFETFFETRHHLTAEYMAKMHGFGYHAASSKKELSENLTHFFDISERPQILEIFTPADMNDKILLDYFDFIS